MAKTGYLTLTEAAFFFNSVSSLDGFSDAADDSFVDMFVMSEKKCVEVVAHWQDAKTQKYLQKTNVYSLLGELLFMGEIVNFDPKARRISC